MVFALNARPSDMPLNATWLLLTHFFQVIFSVAALTQYNFKFHNTMLTNHFSSFVVCIYKRSICSFSQQVINSLPKLCTCMYQKTIQYSSLCTDSKSGNYPNKRDITYTYIRLDLAQYKEISLYVVLLISTYLLR